MGVFYMVKAKLSSGTPVPPEYDHLDLPDWNYEKVWEAIAIGRAKWWVGRDPDMFVRCELAAERMEEKYLNRPFRVRCTEEQIDSMDALARLFADDGQWERMCILMQCVEFYDDDRRPLYGPKSVEWSHESPPKLNPELLKHAHASYPRG